MSFDISKYIEKKNKRSFKRFLKLHFLKIKRKLRNKNDTTKIGFKYGLRRLVIVLIILFTLLLFIFYILSKDIFRSGIVLCCGVFSYLIYLILESIITWIFAGFNIDFSKIKLPKIELNKNSTIIFIVLILAGAYIYVEHSKIAYQEKLRQEKIRDEEIKQELYNACIKNAAENYSNNWDRACVKIGRKKDCALPKYNADTIEKWHSEAKKECMEKFKNNAF